MASSDNVVRAGLTPKFIDVAVFLELLEYDSSSSHRLSPSTDGSTTAQYFTPPVKDFALVRCSKVSGEFLTHATGSAIAFCNDGEIVLNCSETGVTLALCAGDAVYLPTITPSLTYSAVHGDMFIACASN